MGAEEGTRDMTWEQIEERANKLRAKGGAEGGNATQILARAGALVSGAPPDASGQPTKKAALAHGRRGGHARHDVGAD